MTGTISLNHLPHWLASAARDLGPMAPKPVVAGVPLETIPLALCHARTAACVIFPKYPVTRSALICPALTRNVCNFETSPPVAESRAPSTNVLVRTHATATLVTARGEDAGKGEGASDGAVIGVGDAPLVTAPSRYFGTLCCMYCTRASVSAPEYSGCTSAMTSCSKFLLFLCGNICSSAGSLVKDASVLTRTSESCNGSTFDASFPLSTVNSFTIPPTPSRV